MKYLCYLLLSLVFLFLGCSTDNDAPDPKTAEYYFRFNIDGVPIDYKYTPGFQINLTGVYDYDENSENYAINIGGYRNILESLTNGLVFFAIDKQAISTGINYSNIPGKGDDFPDLLFNLGYYDSDGNLYLAAGAGNNPTFDLWKPAFMEFSEIADTYISGTFSGTLIRYDNSNGTNQFVDSVVVSEGKFKVPRP